MLDEFTEEQKLYLQGLMSGLEVARKRASPSSGAAGGAVFARSGAESYVQHRMLEYGAELWKWLETGAHFYVCGDAQRMAHDVDQALKRICIEHGGMTAEGAATHVAALAKEGRYQRDVY